MTKKRFIFLLLFILIITIGTIAIAGNMFMLYWDIPSLILVPIIPYIIASFVYPFAEQKKFNRELL